ncbi:hypothetical protein BDZ91DRAFT_175045 [Kalaharituber pfeilii]|nr:hypothetical protein BDZ91DRAFT_175045 [Kalaharituber pfeilii]
MNLFLCSLSVTLFPQPSQISPNFLSPHLGPPYSSSPLISPLLYPFLSSPPHSNPSLLLPFLPPHIISSSFLSNQPC